VWALLVDGRFGPGLPPAEPFPIPVHTGDVRVDVQAALAMLAPYWGYRPLLDISDEEARDQLARASVMALSYVAQSARGIGVPAVPQSRIDESATITERFMTRWRGEPDPRHIKAVDAYWVSACEHGMNASTFTARVIASTGADVAAALSGAIGAMSGPLHGGAPARVLPMIAEVERTEDPTGLVKGILDRKEKLMGFGHRVYRAEDPRARVLRRTCQELDAPRYEVAAALEQAALAVLRERRPDHPIETNVEFWAAVILDFAEVPPHMMPAMFTSARTAGWSAHVMEQKRESKLVRPSAQYIGPGPRRPEDVDGWDEIAHA
jgi:citrate synthase